MKYSFPRYLLSKQTVDDRALNKDVLDTLKTNLPSQPLRIIEAGAGIGTMLRRLVRWDVIQQAEYVMVDEMPENAAYASAWTKEWAEESGLSAERTGEDHIRIFDDTRDIHIQIVISDVFDFIQKNESPADLLISNAFLDLLPMPDSLPKILSLTRDLAWLTVNFDGVTTLEPIIDAALDERIERLYHASMDARVTGSASKSGRRLFMYLQDAVTDILAAGSSDWMVHARKGKYPDDEAYFLHFIMQFFEDTLQNNPNLDANAFENWLKIRHSQIDRGELIYIAHQMDFLARV